MKAAGRLLNQVGLYLGVRAEFAAARKAYERALAIDEAAYGPDHPEVAIRVNNLGSVLRDLGDLAGARAHYERALAIDEARPMGPDSSRRWPSGRESTWGIRAPGPGGPGGGQGAL